MHFLYSQPTGTQAADVLRARALWGRCLHAIQELLDINTAPVFLLDALILGLEEASQPTHHQTTANSLLFLLLFCLTR